MTAIEEFSNGQDFCNYHIEMGMDPEKQITDVSLWCIGEYLWEEMQRVIVECWRNGLTVRWYDWQIGEREDLSSRHSIILRKKMDRVQIMVKHNQTRRGEHHREQRESSFIYLQQFNWQVLRQASLAQQSMSFH